MTDEQTYILAGCVIFLCAALAVSVLGRIFTEDVRVLAEKIDLAQQQPDEPTIPTTYRFTEINDDNPEGYPFDDDYRRVIIRENATGMEILMLEGEKGIAAVILPQSKP